MSSRNDVIRMIGRGLLVAALAAMLAAVAVGQQTRQTETGRVTADLIEYDFGKHAFTATGNTHVTIEGAHRSEIRAPSLSMDLSESMDVIRVIEARGPVNFEVLTAPDDAGTRRRIVASASRSAVYRQAEETVVLTGNAQADVTTVPADGVEAAHFTGESIVVNLRTSTLSVRQATIEVTTEVEGGGQ